MTRYLHNITTDTIGISDNLKICHRAESSKQLWICGGHVALCTRVNNSHVPRWSENFVFISAERGPWRRRFPKIDLLEDFQTLSRVLVIDGDKIIAKWILAVANRMFLATPEVLWTISVSDSNLTAIVALVVCQDLVSNCNTSDPILLVLEESLGYEVLYFIWRKETANIVSLYGRLQT